MAADAPREQSPSMSTATKVLIGLTVMGLLVFAASVIGVVVLVNSEETAEVQEGSFLMVELKTLPESPMVGQLVLEPDQFPPLATELAEGIRAAATDDRIQGMVLRFEGASGGWGTFQEIRTAIDEFRAAGKPCLAYAETYGNGSYYLASGCDVVALAPGGMTMVSGLSIATTYYAGTFEKIGVVPEFEHVGDFKSAIEVYERTGPSEEAAQAMDYLLDGLYGDMVKGMAAGRGLTDAQMQALIDDPPLSAEEAQERGLVDQLAFWDALYVASVEYGTPAFDEAIGALHILDEDQREALSDRYTPMGEYIKELRQQHEEKEDKIAVIYADGAIVSGGGDPGLFGGGGLGDQSYAEWMTEARQDDAVKAVVVRVNSPGGSALASDMMWHQAALTKEAGKPVVISMANYAASGGYYMSANSDWIVAQPGTITGSIGIFAGKLAIGGAYEKVGLSEHEYLRGQVANLFSMTQPFSEHGRAVIREWLQDGYHGFVSKVAAGRGMTYDETHAVAQGRVWTGTQALDRGLVDELGGLETALAKAAELAQVEDYGVARLPRQKTFIEMILEDLEGSSAATGKVQLELPAELAMMPGAREALMEMERLQAMTADGGQLMYLPGSIEVR